MHRKDFTKAGLGRGKEGQGKLSRNEIEDRLTMAQSCHALVTMLKLGGGGGGLIPKQWKANGRFQELKKKNLCVIFSLH